MSPAATVVVIVVEALELDGIENGVGSVVHPFGHPLLGSAVEVVVPWTTLKLLSYTFPYLRAVLSNHSFSAMKKLI